MPINFNVVAVGRAYTDIVSAASSAFLNDHNIPLDGQRECSIAELKDIRDGLTQTEIFPGGPGANTAAIISALGGRAGFFGKVYADAAGKSFIQDFTQRGVEWCCPPYALTPEISPTCLVLLANNQRSFAYNPGCADYFAATDFANFDFSQTHFFLIEAHLLTSQIAKAVILGAMIQAKNQTRLVINLQGIQNWNDAAEIVKVIADQADIVVGNQTEQQAFSQAMKALDLEFHGQQITTQGANGAVISQSGQSLCHTPAAAPENFVNSNGAGDAFIAGYLFAQSKGLSIQKSMSAGTQVAAAILSEAGARPTRSLAHLIG